MHDSLGRTLSVGDHIFTNRYGVCVITTYIQDTGKGDEYIAGDSLDREGCGFGYNWKSFHQEFPEVFLIRSWTQMAEEAHQIQNAYNLRGVLNSFLQIVREVGARLSLENLDSGNDAVAYHPISRAFADKVASLTGTQDASPIGMMGVQDWIQAQREGKTVEEWRQNKCPPGCDHRAPSCALYYYKNNKPYKDK